MLRFNDKFGGEENENRVNSAHLQENAQGSEESDILLRMSNTSPKRIL